MTTNNPPVATVTVKDVCTRGRQIRRMDWVRSGTCPVHNKVSQDFVGENENGWIFRCGGWSKDEAKARRKELVANLTDLPCEGDPVIPGLAHYFVNIAPNIEAD